MKIMSQSMSTVPTSWRPSQPDHRCDGAYGVRQGTKLGFFPRVGDAGVGHDFPLSADSLYHEQVIAFHHAVAESDVVGAGVIPEIAGAFRTCPGTASEVEGLGDKQAQLLKFVRVSLLARTTRSRERFWRRGTKDGHLVRIVDACIRHQYGHVAVRTSDCPISMFHSVRKLYSSAAT